MIYKYIQLLFTKMTNRIELIAKYLYNPVIYKKKKNKIKPFLPKLENNKKSHDMYTYVVLGYWHRVYRNQLNGIP